MSNNFDDLLSDIASKSSLNANFDIKEISYVESFIKDNKIVVGKSTITPDIIYALYCDQHRPPLARRTFAKYFKTFFTRKFSGNVNFYFLDPVPFNVHPSFSVWKIKALRNFKYLKTKYNNIKHTPEGYMIFIEFGQNQGRRIFGFERSEKKAAQLADQLALYYFGETYPKLNFKNSVLKEDEVLLNLLSGKHNKDEPQEKTIQKNTQE